MAVKVPVPLGRPLPCSKYEDRDKTGNVGILIVNERRSLHTSFGYSKASTDVRDVNIKRVRKMDFLMRRDANYT